MKLWRTKANRRQIVWAEFSTLGLTVFVVMAWHIQADLKLII